MKNKLTITLGLLAVSLLSSCEVIGGIFKAGAYVGIIGVLLVIGIIFWVISKFSNKS